MTAALVRASFTAFRRRCHGRCRQTKSTRGGYTKPGTSGKVWYCSDCRPDKPKEPQP